jgi:TATA-box binding protein (TBP) (component of TFIID and TFIIIB)
MNINNCALLSMDKILSLYRPMSHLNPEILPKELFISTMTMTCRFETEFLTENIGKYINLSYSGILGIKYGSNQMRELEGSFPKKKNKRAKEKKKTNFYNQTTVLVQPKTKKKPVNVKLFKNGSIQMTGCKSIADTHSVLEILCNELRKERAIIDPTTLSKVIVKPFTTSKETIYPEKIKDMNIRMINSNFKVDYPIDLNILNTILTNMNIECTYEPCVHACVNIKFNYKNEKKISIFVFKSGSIIITGATKFVHIAKSYDYITEILKEHHDNILLSKIDISDPEIQKILMSS